ncbi:hypothetical protein SDC9_102702 [bioreactor metagenome]|uniref:Uncharacterized protein n=1 Tax=bioreactor metagenome TaxID=1076179 RepID=A0A645B2H8_9ZZZZ
MKRKSFILIFLILLLERRTSKIKRHGTNNLETEPIIGILSIICSKYLTIASKEKAKQVNNIYGLSIIIFDDFFNIDHCPS